MTKISDGAQNFACYLIDRCEGETITEESIQRWLGKMLSDPQYAATPASIADTAGAKPVAMTFDEWAAERFPAKCLSTKSDTREMDEAREFAREGWQAAIAATPASSGDTAGAKPVARVSYRVEADGDTYSFFEWLGDVPPQGTLLYTAKVPSLDDAQIQRLWVIANTKRVPEFIESTRALLAATPASSVDTAGAKPDLHAQIMNIRCATPKEFGINMRIAYQQGHRDARHAAADLANAATPASSVADAAGASEVHIATVYEDNDGTKHVQLDVENFDDLPVGMKLYARYENGL